MAVCCPNFAQSGQRKFRQGNQSVLGTFASVNMDDIPFRLDITHLQGQGFAQPKPHRVGGQKKDSIANFFGGIDNGLDFGWRENIRNSLNLGRFYDINPIPFFLEDEFPEMLKAEPVDFNRAP